MKAFLLAAGEGTRLRPLTENIPKCLVPINGKPLLAIWLELCERHGIDEVLINLHWRVDAVRRFISESKWRLAVRLFEEPELLGSAGTVAANRSWIGDDECFWILYADVLTDVDLSKMLAFHRLHGDPYTIGLVPTDQPHRCGIATLDSRGLVISFEEKPERPSTNLAFSGVFLSSPALYELMPVGVPLDFGATVLPRLAGHMRGYLIQEYLLDIGTMQNYEAAQQAWSERVRSTAAAADAKRRHQQR